MRTRAESEKTRVVTAAALLRPLPLVLALSLLALPRAPVLAGRPEGRDASLCQELAAAHLTAAASDVHWIETPEGALASRFRTGRAVVLAEAKGERADVYLVDARLSPEGALLRLGAVRNLTRTSVVGEANLVGSQGHAAWTIGSDDSVYRVELADFGHEHVPEGEGWTRLARVQHALTNLQHTGTLAGIGRRSFKLDPAAKAVSLEPDPARLRIRADDHVIGIPWGRGGTIESERFVREEDRELASPGNLVTWAVDRARESSWVGDERMQLTKAIVYAVLDRVDTAVGSVRPTSEPARAGDELGASEAKAPPPDPESGWPPPPATPLVTPALPDEGQWFSLDRDPYVHVNPGAPSPLVTTYLRAEGSRPESRVVALAWDTRQVELDMVPGTEEPQSATGETGTGMIPRDPKLVTRLLGAFNGGFQSTHGDFGMKSDGEVVVPPKPFAATIARTRDGSTVFGTWPRELSIPDDFVSFRQNLTPLVEDGKFNPWHREWWGGVPHDWEDETRTVRSGVCLAKRGFAAYLYGTKVDHTHLARAMIALGCDYGIHLDMNQGHTGVELYRVYPDGEASSVPKLSGKLDGHWQAEAPVLGLSGYTFRGRKLTRNMQLMHFPRYIRRGARDYFYLALRPALPGRALSMAAPGGGEPGEGVWRAVTADGSGAGGPLPFPLPLVTTTLRPDPARPEAKLRIVKLDPGLLRVGGAEEAAVPAVIALGAGDPTSGVAGENRGGARDTTLWLDQGRAVVAPAASPPDATATPLIAGAARPSAVRAGACVDDEGMVVYAEVATAADPARDGALLDLAFDAARCGPRLYLTTGLALGLGGTLGSHDLSGHPVRMPSGAVRLVRNTTPRARRVFTDTKVLPPAEWMPLQRQTRYFPKPEAAPSASEPGSALGAEASPAIVSPSAPEP